MKHVIKLISILAVALCLFIVGCSSSKKIFCGCPNEHGMVGYK